MAMSLRGKWCITNQCNNIYIYMYSSIICILFCYYKPIIMQTNTCIIIIIQNKEETANQQNFHRFIHTVHVTYVVAGSSADRVCI